MVIQRFIKENVSKEPNTGGVYRFYNKDRKLIYVGSASGIWGTKFQPKVKHSGR